MKIHGRALAGIIALIALARPAIAAEPTVMDWSVDGASRRALVFVPAAGADQKKAPLVFVFHGHGGTMRSAERLMRVEEAWPQAIVVYMQGLPTVTLVDPDGKRPGWQLLPGDDGDRDLKFVDAVLATMHNKYAVDDSRVYTMGFSNGAFFSYLLWSQRAHTFAAFASCAGRIMPTLKLDGSKPILQIAGEKDPIVPFEKQKETIAQVRQINGATGEGQACGKGCTLYSSSKDAPVMTFIHSGGHLYPPEATGLIVDFFKKFTLSSAP